jgi:hypothetical protein
VGSVLEQGRVIVIDGARRARAAPAPQLDETPPRYPRRYEGFRIALEIPTVDEREPGEIARRPEVVGLEPEATQGRAIVRDVSGGVGHRGSDAARLVALDDGSGPEWRARLPPEMPEEIRAPRGASEQHVP